MSESVRRMKANRVLAAAACAACSKPLAFGSDAAVCGACEAPHHAPCWDRANGCANIGCANAPLAQLADPAPIPGAADGQITCSKCGSSYSARRATCPNCGTKTPASKHSHARSVVRGDAPGATQSLVYGIISLLICGIIFGIVAIQKSNEAKRAIKANPNLTGEGKATAGLVLGIIGLIGWALVIVIRVAK